MFEQTVSGFWLKGILACAQAQGISQDEVLKKAGVAQLPSSIDESAGSNDRVSLDATVNIWNAAIELTEDPVFGFHMGRQFRPNWFHLIHYLWANSPDVQSAIETALKYQALISDGGDVALIEGQDSAIIEYQPRAANLPFSYHQIDAVLTILVSMMRWTIDDQFSPLKIKVPHSQPVQSDEFDAFFNCEIEYESQIDAKPNASQIILEKSWLKKPLIGADPNLLDMHQQLADQKLAELGRTSVSAQIISKLNILGKFQNLTKESIASQLGTSPRTLQRKLQQENTSFTELSDNLRKSMAERYIQHGYSTNKLVETLDFKEVSSLHKACKRWFGKSLQAYREEIS